MSLSEKYGEENNSPNIKVEYVDENAFIDSASEPSPKSKENKLKYEVVSEDAFIDTPKSSTITPPTTPKPTYPNYQVAEYDQFAAFSRLALEDEGWKPTKLKANDGSDEILWTKKDANGKPLYTRVKSLDEYVKWRNEQTPDEYQQWSNIFQSGVSPQDIKNIFTEQEQIRKELSTPPIEKIQNKIKALDEEIAKYPNDSGLKTKKWELARELEKEQKWQEKWGNMPEYRRPKGVFAQIEKENIVPPITTIGASKESLTTPREEVFTPEDAFNLKMRDLRTKGQIGQAVWEQFKHDIKTYPQAAYNILTLYANMANSTIKSLTTDIPMGVIYPFKKLADDTIFEYVTDPLYKGFEELKKTYNDKDNIISKILYTKYDPNLSIRENVLQDPSTLGTFIGNGLASTVWFWGLSSLKLGQATIFGFTSLMEGGSFLKDLDEEEKTQGLHIDPLKKAAATLIVGIANGALEYAGESQVVFGSAFRRTLAKELHQSKNLIDAIRRVSRMTKDTIKTEQVRDIFNTQTKWIMGSFLAEGTEELLQAYPPLLVGKWAKGEPLTINIEEGIYQPIESGIIGGLSGAHFTAMTTTQRINHRQKVAKQILDRYNLTNELNALTGQEKDKLLDKVIVPIIESDMFIAESMENIGYNAKEQKPSDTKETEEKAIGLLSAELYRRLTRLKKVIDESESEGDEIIKNIATNTYNKVESQLKELVGWAQLFNQDNGIAQTIKDEYTPSDEELETYLLKTLGKLNVAEEAEKNNQDVFKPTEEVNDNDIQEILNRTTEKPVPPEIEQLKNENTPMDIEPPEPQPPTTATEEVQPVQPELRITGTYKIGSVDYNIYPAPATREEITDIDELKEVFPSLSPKGKYYKISSDNLIKGLKRENKKLYRIVILPQLDDYYQNGKMIPYPKNMHPYKNGEKAVEVDFFTDEDSLERGIEVLQSFRPDTPPLAVLIIEDPDNLKDIKAPITIQENEPIGYSSFYVKFHGDVPLTAVDKIIKIGGTNDLRNYLPKGQREEGQRPELVTERPVGITGVGERRPNAPQIPIAHIPREIKGIESEEKTKARKVGVFEKAILGNKTDIILENINEPVEGHYAIVDLKDPNIKLDILQNRGMGESNPINLFGEQGENLIVGEMLLPTSFGQIGSPIALDTGEIIGGNTRTKGLQIIATQNEQKYKEYLTELSKIAPVFGFSQEDIETASKELETPVLIRIVPRETIERMKGGLDRAVSLINKSTLQGMGIASQAADDAKLIDLNDIIEAQFDIAENQDLTVTILNRQTNPAVRKIIFSILTKQDRQTYFDDADRLTFDGAKRVARAILAKIFEFDKDSAALAALIESGDSNVKTIANAIFKTIGKLAVLKQYYENKQSTIIGNIIKSLSAAIDQFCNIKLSGDTTLLNTFESIKSLPGLGIDMPQLVKDIFVFLRQFSKKESVLKEFFADIAKAGTLFDKKKPQIIGKINYIKASELFRWAKDKQEDLNAISKNPNLQDQEKEEKLKEIRRQYNENIYDIYELTTDEYEKNPEKVEQEEYNYSNKGIDEANLFIRQYYFGRKLTKEEEEKLNKYLESETQPQVTAAEPTPTPKPKEPIETKPKPKEPQKLITKNFEVKYDSDISEEDRAKANKYAAQILKIVNTTELKNQDLTINDILGIVPAKYLPKLLNVLKTDRKDEIITAMAFSLDINEAIIKALSTVQKDIEIKYLCTNKIFTGAALRKAYILQNEFMYSTLQHSIEKAIQSHLTLSNNTTIKNEFYHYIQHELIHLSQRPTLEANQESILKQLTNLMETNETAKSVIETIAALYAMDAYSLSRDVNRQKKLNTLLNDFKFKFPDEFVFAAEVIRALTLLNNNITTDEELSLEGLINDEKLPQDTRNKLQQLQDNLKNAKEVINTIKSNRDYANIAELLDIPQEYILKGGEDGEEIDFVRTNNLSNPVAQQIISSLKGRKARLLQGTVAVATENKPTGDIHPESGKPPTGNRGIPQPEIPTERQEGGKLGTPVSGNLPVSNKYEQVSPTRTEEKISPKGEKKEQPTKEPAPKKEKKKQTELTQPAIIRPKNPFVDEKNNIAIPNKTLLQLSIPRRVTDKQYDSFINTLKTIIQERKTFADLTEEEAEQLISYQGFGAMSQEVIDLLRGDEQAQAKLKDFVFNDLKGNLDDYLFLLESILYSYNTPPIILKGINELSIKHFGVQPNTVYADPFAGSGNAALTLKQNFFKKVFLIEAGLVPHTVSKILNPTVENIKKSAFDPNLENYILQNYGGIDLIVTNVPFNNKITIEMDNIKMPLHDAAIAQCYKLLAPGGVMAAITSASAVERWARQQMKSSIAIYFQKQNSYGKDYYPLVFANILLPIETFNIKVGTSLLLIGKPTAPIAEDNYKLMERRFDNVVKEGGLYGYLIGESATEKKYDTRVATLKQGISSTYLKLLAERFDEAINPLKKEGKILFSLRKDISIDDSSDDLFEVETTKRPESITKKREEKLSQAEAKKSLFGKQEITVSNRPIAVFTDTTIKPEDRGVFFTTDRMFSKSPIGSIFIGEYDSEKEAILIKTKEEIQFNPETGRDELLNKLQPLKAIYKNLDNNKVKTLTQLVKLSNIVSEIAELQRTDNLEESWAQEQKEANILYDKILKDNKSDNLHNLINKYPPTLDLSWMNALEKYSTEEKKYVKSDIFSNRVYFAKEEDFANSPAEAVIKSAIVYSGLNIPYIAKLLNMNEKETEQLLLDKELAFHSYEYDVKLKKYVMKIVNRYELLSGNLFVKHRLLKESPIKNENVTKAIELLERNMPNLMTIEQAKNYVELHDPCLSPEFVINFLTEVFHFSCKNYLDKTNNQWIIHSKSKDYRGGGLKDLQYVTRQLGCPNAISLEELLEVILNNKPARTIKSIDSFTKKEVINKQANAQYKAVLNKIRQEWRQFVKTADEKLLQDYCDSYNETVGGLTRYIPPEVSVTDMKISGMNADIVLRPNQVRAILEIGKWRRGLNLHDVGYGKTFATIATLMLLKQTNNLTKALVVYPNATYSSWKEQVNTLFPNANIYFPSKEEFRKEKDTRKGTLTRIKYNNYDIVFIPASIFAMLSLSPEAEAKYYQKEMEKQEADFISMFSNLEVNKNIVQDMLALVYEAPRYFEKELDAAIKKVEEGTATQISLPEVKLPARLRRLPRGADARRIKQQLSTLIKLKLTLEAKRRLASNKNLSLRDIALDELGFDFFVVDECHRAKSLNVLTQYASSRDEEPLKGLKTGQISNIAYRTLVFAEYIRDVRGNDGSGCLGLTATPLKNSLTELYNMFRIFSPMDLENNNIQCFDDFVKRFADIVPKVTVDVIKNKLKRERVLVVRDADALQKVMSQFTSFSPKGAPAQLPKLKTSDFIRHEIPMDEWQDKVHKNLIKTVDLIKQGAVSPKEWNHLNVVLAGIVNALDPKLLKGKKVGETNTLRYPYLEPLPEDYVSPKIVEAAEAISEIYKKNPEKTQMVIANFGVPHPEIKGMYNVHDELKKQLIKDGVKESDVVMINYAKNSQDFANMLDKIQTGKAKIIIGNSMKLGEGINIHQYLIAQHYLTYPLTPAEMIQALGRIVRAGNTNEQVEVHTYLTKGSADAFCLNLIQRKMEALRAINQGRPIEEGIDPTSDILSELDYQTLAMEATGNKTLIDYSNLLKDLQIAEEKLMGEKTAYTSLQFNKEVLQQDIDRTQATIDKFKEYAETPLPEEIHLTEDLLKKSFDIERAQIDIIGKELYEEGAKPQISTTRMQELEKRKMKHYNRMTSCLVNKQKLVSKEITKEDIQEAVKAVKAIKKDADKFYSSLIEDLKNMKDRLKNIEEEIAHPPDFKPLEEEIMTLQKRKQDIEKSLGVSSAEEVIQKFAVDYSNIDNVEDIDFDKEATDELKAEMGEIVKNDKDNDRVTYSLSPTLFPHTEETTTPFIDNDDNEIKILFSLSKNVDSEDLIKNVKDNINRYGQIGRMLLGVNSEDEMFKKMNVFRKYFEPLRGMIFEAADNPTFRRFYYAVKEIEEKNKVIKGELQESLRQFYDLKFEHQRQLGQAVIDMQYYDSPDFNKIAETWKLTEAEKSAYYRIRDCIQKIREYELSVYKELTYDFFRALEIEDNIASKIMDFIAEQHRVVYDDKGEGKLEEFKEEQIIKLINNILPNIDQSRIKEIINISQYFYRTISPFLKVNHIRHYIPLRRFGKYYVSKFERTEDNEWEVVYAEHFNSKLRATLTYQRLKESISEDDIKDNRIKIVIGDIYKDELPKEFLSKTSFVATEKLIVEEASQYLPEEAIEALKQELIKFQVNKIGSSYMQNRLKRKRVIGASTNLSKIMEEEITGVCGWARACLLAQEFRKAFAKTGQGLDATTKKMIKKYTEYIFKSNIEEFYFIRKLIFIKTLWLSMKSAYANLHAAFTHAVPLLSIHTDIKTAAQAITKAFAEICGYKIGFISLTQDETKFLDELAKRGVVTDSLTKQVAGVHIDSTARQLLKKAIETLSTESDKESPDIDKVLDTIDNVKTSISYIIEALAKIGAKPFGITEIVVRQSVALAAYRLFKNKITDKELLIRKVDEIIEMSQGDYTRAGKPRVQRKIGAVITSLMGFTINDLNLKAFWFSKLISNLPPSEKKKYAKAFLLHYALMLAFGGLISLPIISSLINWVGKKYFDTDVEWWLVSKTGTPGRVAWRGVYAPLHFDISTSLRPNYDYTPRDWTKQDEVAMMILKLTSGMGGELLAKDIAQFARQWEEGQKVAAFTNILPFSLRAPQLAGRGYTSGVVNPYTNKPYKLTNWQGQKGKTIVNYPLGEAILKTFNFTVQTDRDIQMFRSNQRIIKENKTNAKKEFVDRLTHILMKDSTENIDKFREDFKTYNKEARPESRLTIKEILKLAKKKKEEEKENSNED